MYINRTDNVRRNSHEYPGVVREKDEHLTINNTLRDVDFCGKTYKVKQVLIDGTDVVQRVADLARNIPDDDSMEAKRFLRDICETVKFNPQDQLEVENVVAFVFDPSNKKAGEKTGTYGVFTQILQISVDSLTDEIYGLSGFDGSPIGPIGKLK